MESRIVTAVGAVSLSTDPALSRRIQEAMSRAVLDATVDGVTTELEHADELRARMLQARRRVLEDVAALP